MHGGLSDAEIEQRLRAAPDERWHELWQAVDALAAEPVKGAWAGGESVVVDGAERPVTQAPYVVYADSTLDVTARVGALGASEPFDWQAWGGLGRYPDGRGLGEAAVAEAVRMITAIVRADRFVEGALLASLEDGTFMAAIERLRRWYDHEGGGAR